VVEVLDDIRMCKSRCIMERLQGLLNNIKEQCPNIGNAACFFLEDRYVLHVYFRYDSDPIPDDDPMKDGHDHMFIYCIGIEDEDWSIHEKNIVEYYQRCMDKE
jgi:hypothetical protein